MVVKKKSKKESVLEYLKSGQSLTPLDAMQNPDIRSMRLAAIIFELRDEGYTIINKNSTGKKKYAEYRLVP